MLPGPIFIKKCSVCSKPIRQSTIISGNIFGATFWTDGWCDDSSFPDQPLLVICPHCQTPLWIDELEELAIIEPYQEADSQFNDAGPYETPSLEQYFALLEKGVADVQKERYVRLRFWWAGNDLRRLNADQIPMSSREKSNMKALAQMLDESNADDLIMKAEIMRELGRFEDAQELLARCVSENASEAVAIIKDLAEKRDPYVRKMDFE